MISYKILLKKIYGDKMDIKNEKNCKDLKLSKLYSVIFFILLATYPIAFPFVFVGLIFTEPRFAQAIFF